MTVVQILALALLAGPYGGAAWAGIQYKREQLRTPREPATPREDPTPNYWEQRVWGVK